MAQVQRTRRDLLTLALWGGAASLSFGLGYRSVKPAQAVSQITLGNRPQSEPDRSFVVDLWAERPEFIEDKNAFALVTEKHQPERYSVRFLCPRSPNQRSELNLRFPLDKLQSVRSAFIQLTVLASAVYDPMAELHIWVASDATNGRWVELLELSAKTGEDQIPDAFEVTSYVQGASELRLRISCIASHLMYHPTPDDPIGYAACQALRQARYDSFAAKLELWR